MEPLLLLAHKYDIKVAMALCTQFLSESFTPAKYASLDEGHLAQMPHWLALARRLQLTELHASIMACLEHNLSKLAAANPQQPAAAPGKPQHHSCTHCGRVKKYKQANIALDAGSNRWMVLCGACFHKFCPEMPEPLNAFLQIWGLAEVKVNRAELRVSRQQVRDALSGLEAGEVLQLMEMLVAGA